MASCAPAVARAQGGEWALVEARARETAERDKGKGWAYVVSGGVALAISVPAFYLSSDLFARAVFSAGQILGVAAIGYGSYLVSLDDPYSEFRGIVSGVPSLSREQRDQLARRFLEAGASRARSARRIRAISHALTAGLNFTSGATSEHSELKATLFFLGGINTLAALTFAFGSAEEEKLLGRGARVGLAIPGSGRGAGLALRIGF